MIKIPEEIRQLFMKDSIRKNIRIIFPNGELSDITNNNLIAESFSFSESTCSKSELKFGLCEANVVKFETFGIPNIRGLEIDVYHEIDISSLPADFINQHGKRDNVIPYPFYRLPYGHFIVDSCEKQNDMNRRKVIAYTREITWGSFPNPVEKAKFDGTLSIRLNTPYVFNVAAVVASNIFYSDFPELGTFSDVTETRLVDKIFPGIKVSSFSSFKNSRDYRMDIKIGYVYVSKAEDIDTLYRVERPEDTGTAALMEKIYEIINNPNFEWHHNSGIRLEQIQDVMKYGYCSWEGYGAKITTNGSSVTIQPGYTERNIPLDGHIYYYPYLNNINDKPGENSGTRFIPTIRIPVTAVIDMVRTIGGREQVEERLTFKIREYDKTKIYKMDRLPKIYFSSERTKFEESAYNSYSADSNKVDMRKLVEGYAEINAFFGRHTRQGGFEFFRIGANFGLYPREDLYPSEDLYPNDPSGGIYDGSHYISAWYDDDYTKPFDRVSVTYKNKDDKEAYSFYQIVPEDTPGYYPNHYQTYILSDNYLIKNCKFDSAEISAILRTMGGYIGGVRYIPAKVQIKGMPHLETGDVVVIKTRDDGIETIVLSRDLSGIHTLKDTFESK